MKLRSLEAFCAAVEEGTISGAARRMYLSQPSVSERLAELEREARVLLLERSRRGVEPTREGELLYRHARKVLDEIRALEYVLHTLKSKHDMRLRFAASSTLGEHLLPEWLWGFRKKVPGTLPDLFVGNTREVAELVAGGRFAFGLIEGEWYPESLEGIPLLDDELVVVVPPRHRWARGGVRAEELSEEPFISREKGSGTREVVERALSELGVELRVEMEIGSTSAIKEAIEAGMGFSIFSRAAVQLELEAGRLAVAEGFEIPRRFTLIRHPSAEMTPAEERFCEYLFRVCERFRGSAREPARG